MDYNFKVAMTSEHSAIKNGAYMYFENTVYDYTNGGIDGNGWFTATIKGIYRFDLKLTISPYSDSYHYGSSVDVLLDGVKSINMFEDYII